MSEITKRSFPYPIHPAANLAPVDEAVVEDLVERIRTFGYSEAEPLLLHRGMTLDGRHRQEACVRLGIVPPIAKADLKGQTPEEFVLNRHHLRQIKSKDRIVYVIESFPDESATKLARRLGQKAATGYLTLLIEAYKKCKRSKKMSVWQDYAEGRISRGKLFETVGVKDTYKDNRVSQTEHEAALKSVETERQEAVEILEADLEFYKERTKELERRVKSLDPQERIARSAGGDATAEDRLRDRLEFTEEELKKSQKINEQFATKVRDMERMSHAFETAFANVDWTARKVTPPRPSSEGKTRPHEFLALMSDAHYGEVVEPSEALGLSYNADIAKARMEHYRDIIVRFKELRESSYDISKLTVAVLGDMLSGNIHDELRVYNEKNMTEQMTDMTHILNDFAGDFAGEFPEVEFIIIPGNHPRLQKKPEFKKKWDNWEVAMGEAFKLAVEVGPLENVTVTVPHSMVYIHQIFGSRIAMLHGDGIKSNSFAGIPFYGMRNRREGLQALLSSLDIERADMMVMGHFHQHMYWSAECDILINGAIKGGDDYSIGSFLSAPEPVQVLLEFHPEHGLVAQEHITLGHIR